MCKNFTFLNLGMHAVSTLQATTKQFGLAALFCFFVLCSNQTAQAQTGTTLQFDGANDYVLVPQNLSGSYTKEAWINPLIIGSFQNIIAGTNSQFYMNNGTVTASNLLTNVVVTSPAPVTANNWTHVAVTYDDATKAMVLYVNGSAVSSGTVTDPLSFTDTETRIGSTTANSFHFTGLIDEARIWNVVRSAAEISSTMSCELTGDEPGLLIYYNFNQGIGGGNNTGITSLSSGVDNCASNDGTLVNFALTGGTSNFLTGTLPIAPSCGLTYANIQVSGNSNCIVSGNNTPAATWDTDFGVYMFPGIDKTYTIDNTGSADLNIASVSISGTNAADYSVETAPPATIAAGGSGTFTIRFAGTGSGMRTATITVNNDDADEAAYSFAVIGEAASIVPVSLSSFDGYLEAGQIHLQWHTAAEQNNAGFEILRAASANGPWSKIGYVAGTNNPLGAGYNFTDNAPLSGANFYRLNQVDINGAGALSEILNFNFSANAKAIRIFPNPVHSVLTIAAPADMLNTVVQITTVNGSLIRKHRLNAAQTQIDCSGLLNGVYLIRFQDGRVQKFVKQ